MVNAEQQSCDVKVIQRRVESSVTTAAPALRRKSDRAAFLVLPAVAQVYVASITLLGAISLAMSVRDFRGDQLPLFLFLMALAVVTSAAKIELPLGRGQSNLSLAHAVNFWALLALGPAPSVCIAAVSATAQCTLRTLSANPLHRVLFSIASLTVTVWLAALPLDWARGADPTSLVSLLRGVAIIAPLYFVINTGLVAGAVALSTRQSITQVWQRNFLWSAPSYLVG